MLYKGIIHLEHFCALIFGNMCEWNVLREYFTASQNRKCLRNLFRKIQNGRQIMFQCERSYSMVEGPSGATCIAGQWSPPQLPRY
jgi:Sushi repeat (SCR repeat)